MVCPHLISVIWLKLWPCLNANVPEKSKKFNSYHASMPYYIWFVLYIYLARKEWVQNLRALLTEILKRKYIWEWKDYEIQELRVFNATKLLILYFYTVCFLPIFHILKNIFKKCNSHTSKVLQYFDVLYLAVSTLQFINWYYFRGIF